MKHGKMDLSKRGLIVAALGRAKGPMGQRRGKRKAKMRKRDPGGKGAA